MHAVMMGKNVIDYFHIDQKHDPMAFTYHRAETLPAEASHAIVAGPPLMQHAIYSCCVAAGPKF